MRRAKSRAEEPMRRAKSRSLGESWWRLRQATRTKRANDFTDLQASLGMGIPRFNGTGKIAVGRGLENHASS